jgi:hypothetical protein
MHASRYSVGVLFSGMLFNGMLSLQMPTQARW